MELFNSQFGHPRGWLGSLAGTIMVWENKERNRWAISLLNLQATDHVLEIGFGPGWAIEQMAQLVTRGLVAGVDASETMLRDASRRNAAAIRAGRVQLKQALAIQLPFADNTFDKVLAVNSFQAWGDAAQGLREVRRVLKPGGRVAITSQPVWAKTDTEVFAVGEEMERLFNAAHLQHVRLTTKDLQPLTISVIAEKP